MAQPTNIHRSREDIGRPPDGIIRYEVQNISNLDENGVTSAEVEVRGIPWLALVCKRRYDGEDRLSVYLSCMDNRSTLWSIDVEHHHSLIHSDTSKNVTKFHKMNVFNHDTSCWGKRFVKWRNLVSEGYVRDDTITVEIRFWIKNMRGIRTTQLIDFANPNDPCHDVALVIGGEKIYVSKQVLAVHSPVFKTTFFGEFAEKNKKEIELNEIDRDEFLEMLRVIYSLGQKITDGNVIFLLRLGDRFQIKVVLDMVEDYLVSSAVPSLASKLLLSDHFRLIKLQDRCLNRLMSLQEVKGLKETPEYRELSETTKVALLERMFQLVED